MQILPQLFRHGQMSGVEALHLIHRRASIFGKGEDIDLTMRVHDPHADRSVSQGIEGVSLTGMDVVPEIGAIQKFAKLPLYDV